MNKTISIPYDFRASLSIPNWQDNFVTLVDEKQVDILFNEQDKRIINYIDKLPNNIKRDNFLLSLPLLIQRVNGCIIALIAVEEAKNNSLNLISTLPEVNFILTGDDQYLEAETTRITAEKRLNNAFIRRIIRTASWTKPWRLINTIFRPNIYALGHTEVSRQYARSLNDKIYFFQANELVAKILKNSNNNFSPNYLSSLVSDFIRVLSGHIKKNSAFYDNFNILIEKIIYKKLLEDSIALDACYNYSKLPKNIWIGTGTAYNFRMLALAVIRKGGEVTSFGHSVGSVLAPPGGSWFYGELAVTNKYIDVTSNAGALFKSYFFDKHPVAINSSLQISGIKKNLRFKDTEEVKSKKTKPTVIYTSNAFHEVSRDTPFSHYMAYLNWQLKLTDILDKMNINLVCQPHPGGIFASQDITHPLRKKYNTSVNNFETIKDQADIFLVDFIHSTTFGEILVTEKPIIRISWNDNSSYMGISQHIKVLLDKRCRTISASIQESGSLEIDEEELKNVMLTNWQEKVNPSDFRKLLIG